MTISTDILERVSARLGRRDLTQREFADWFGGAANGGPHGDGLYPLTDSTGFTRMVPSPSRQMATMGNGLDLAGFEKLPVANEAEVAAAPPEMLGKTKDGQLRRFTTNLFAARRTKDLDVLSGSEYAEQIACLTSTGAERRIAIGALQRTVGDVIDPAQAPYNVRYDFKKAKPAYSTAGSNVITTAEPIFDASDRGKAFAMSNARMNGDNSLYTGFIGQVVDSRTVKVYRDTNFTNPAIADYSPQFYEQWEFICGTDNTVGMQRALDEAEPAPGVYNLGRVVLLTGVACVRQLNFGSISIVGLAQTTCGIAALPQLASDNGQRTDPRAVGQARRSIREPNAGQLHAQGILDL